MDWIKNMSLGKKIYAGLWAITGVFLIILLVLFVTWKDKVNQKVPNTTGYEIVQKAVPAGEVAPLEEDVKIKITDVNGDDITTSEVKNVYLLNDPQQASPVELKEGEYLELATVKMILDYKNYFDFNDYLINDQRPAAGEPNESASWAAWYEQNDEGKFILTEGEPTDDPAANIDKLVLKWGAIYTIEAPLAQELTDAAKQAQNSLAGVGLGFLIFIFGAVMATVFVSIKEKGGNK